VTRSLIETRVRTELSSPIPDNGSLQTTSGTRDFPVRLINHRAKIAKPPKKYAKMANIVKRLLTEKTDLVESSRIKSLSTHLKLKIRALGGSRTVPKAVRRQAANALESELVHTERGGGRRT